MSQVSQPEETSEILIKTPKWEPSRKSLAFHGLAYLTLKTGVFNGAVNGISLAFKWEFFGFKWDFFGFKWDFCVSDASQLTCPVAAPQ